MQLKYVRVLEAGRRVQGFLNSLVAAMAALVPVGLRAELDDLVSRVTTFQVEQEAAAVTARSETANLVQRRADLLERFAKPVARIAERKLRDKPDFKALIVPLSLNRISDVVPKITAMIDVAAKYEAVFVAGGLGTDFLTRLEEEVAALNSGVEARGRHRARLSAATRGTVDGVKELKEIIAQLDAILRPVFAEDAALLADWDASKQITQTAVQPLPTGSPTLDAGEVGPNPDAGATPPAAPEILTTPALTIVKPAA